MPLVDWPLHQLKQYKPESTAQPDFDSFWRETLAEAAKTPLDVKLTPYPFPNKTADLFELTYRGGDGTVIHGWYVRPKEASTDNPVPAVIRYHGYTGSRGIPVDQLHWTTLGMAAIIVDVRGQGGQTPDSTVYPQGGIAGWLTYGILDPKTYYYRQVYVDSVRAVDVADSLPEIDSSRIGVCGGSQGGGLALAVAGLDARPKITMPAYPFLSDFRRSVEQAGAGPYPEIVKWFRMFDPERKREADVFRTLSYFDVMNHAARVKARTLMAITLQDTVCPPSTCFAAYNHIEAPKEYRIYPDYGHEALPFFQEEMMRFAAEHL
ncbi:acetylxylan esterase [Paenibacillus thermoaerophilus]|uniref:Acetylxylan esterase n=1 Tax=Paenibacillus thermoaerophilus TaxID=1215385 RepID=A0ABW2V7F2_9BACL|nr:acetylxylan esterase [Paenibacillus thermoaerophilus]TMV11110.1 acetylxylan esterase [Paenibacillus thermoaerophilus]